MKPHSPINLLSFSFLVCILGRGEGSTESEDGLESQRYRIEGKVTVPFTTDQDWTALSRVFLDGGQFLGFLRNDGGFVVNNVPTGSYILEIVNPTYVFEPYRVDINSKGKIRARRLNNLNPSAVQTVTYPLKFKARGKASYFQMREQWRITDFLFSPMVMMMVLPFLMIMVLPKLINTADPETQKEMQSQMNILNTNKNFPDMSELMTKWLGGGGSTPPKKAGKTKGAIKKRT